jgi:hypothetical protein
MNRLFSVKITPPNVSSGYLAGSIRDFSWSPKVLTRLVGFADFPEPKIRPPQNVSGRGGMMPKTADLDPKNRPF